MDGSDFSFPQFYSYPPFFTLQPIQETREKQSSLWGSLILSYCKHLKIYTLHVGADIPLFNNTAISRRLSPEAQTAFINDLVAAGSAEWLDKGKTQCCILWRKLEEWTSYIHQFASTYGLRGGVMAVDDLIRGDEVRGTDLYGMDRALLLRALKLLEQQGKARLFSGSTPDEEGVKFM